MKYIKTTTVGNNELHKFISEATSFSIGKKHWKNKTLSIAETKVYHQREFRRKEYLLVIRYDNSPQDYQIGQYGMNKDELRQFRDVINNILEQ
jgi:hypothetical protein